MNKYVESIHSMYLLEKEEENIGEAASYPTALLLSCHLFCSLRTDNRNWKTSLLFVALSSFFLNMSFLPQNLLWMPFGTKHMPICCNRFHCHRHCFSLSENVPFLCLCHATASCLLDRMTIGHNYLFRNMFYLNISSPIMSEFTWLLSHAPLQAKVLYSTLYFP